MMSRPHRPTRLTQTPIGAFELMPNHPESDVASWRFSRALEASHRIRSIGVSVASTIKMEADVADVGGLQRFRKEASQLESDARNW